MTRDRGVTRRDLLRLAGAAPLLVSPLARAGQATPPPARAGGASPPAAAPRVPLSALGRTGAEVSRLGLGLDFDPSASLLLLKLAVRLGVTQWDTADTYEAGGAEAGIGRYFKKFPDDRAQVHLATKTHARGAAELEAMLTRSLTRLHTDHVDLYYLHAVSSARELGDEARRFAEAQKEAGRIRAFGLSTHANMPALLDAAAARPWIDVVMVKYNYRLMEDRAMRDAMRRCGEAGKGLIVMKVLGDGPVRREDANDMRLAGHFLARGFTPRQAALKAAWENPAVSCASLHINSTEDLASFVAAALDRTSLSADDLEALRRHAESTRQTFCAGCASRCEPAAEGLPIADVLRFLTYAGRPGQGPRARLAFGELSPELRRRLAEADLAGAEAACPNGLPIARLVREACQRLA
jgi:uncharacterized protein